MTAPTSRRGLPPAERKRALAAAGYRCADCGRRFPEHDLQVDHVQEVVDHGPDHPGNYRVLCAPQAGGGCHRAKTTRTRQQRAATGRGSAPVLDTAPSLSWLRWPLMGSVCSYSAGLAFDDPRGTLGSGVLLAGAAAGVAGRRVLARRRAVADRLAEVLAKETHQPPGTRAVRVQRWRGYEPVRFTVRYSHLFADEDAEARARVERLAAHKTGLDLVADWQPARDLVVLRERAADDPVERAAEPEPERAPAARDQVLARISRAAVAALGEATVTDARWHDDGALAGFRIRYSPEAKVHLSTVQDDVEEKVETLLPRSGVWRARWRTFDDLVEFTDAPDPLAARVPLPPLSAAVDLDAVPLAVTEAGEQWFLRLRGVHLLIGGASGAGKGSVVWGIVRGVAPAVRAGLCELRVIDPKGGMELGQGEPLFAAFAAGTEGAPDLLRDAVEYMQARAARLRKAGQRLHVPTPGDPHVVVLIDEIATLTKYAGDRKAREEINSLLGLLLSQGRAVGMTVVGALQDPKKDVLALRDLFTTRIALRLVERMQTDMVLGDGARALGARTDKISKDSPGTGYVMIDGQPEPVRIRLPFVDDAEIARVVAEYRPGPRRPVTAALDPAPAEPEPATAEWDDTRVRVQPDPRADRVIVGDLVEIDAVRGVVVSVDCDERRDDRIEIEWKPDAGGPPHITSMDCAEPVACWR